MAFSVSPAVGIREIDATETTPARYSAPGAIAGVFKWGPVMEPILISTEGDLEALFHRPSDFNAETWFSAANFLSYSDRLYVTRVTDGAIVAENSSSPFKAKYPGALGNSIGVSYVATAAGFKQNIVNAGETSGSIQFGSKILEFPSTINAFENVVAGDALTIGSAAIGFQSLQVVAINLVSTADPLNPQVYRVELDKIYAIPETDLAKITVVREWRFTNILANAPATNRIHIVVYDNDGGVTGVRGSVLEVYEGLSLNPASKNADGTTSFYKNVIQNRSKWIATASLDASATARPAYSVMSGGNDGSAEGAASFAAVAMGYDKYRNAEEIDISFVIQGKAIGGIRSSGLANYIISNIITVRNDCMAAVSPGLSEVEPSLPTYAKIENTIAWRSSLVNTSYAVADTGYKYQYDKYNDVYRWIPLNADIAGIMAAVDSFISPAGYKRGHIKNAIKLSYSPNKAQRDQLYGSDINPVVSQIGHGTLLLGDKTLLGTNSAFNRINVRRLFIDVEKSIATASKFILFDNNNEFTQSQFKNMVVPYLKNIQGLGGMIDFKVISDSTVNTPSIVDDLTFRALVMIKPPRSINYIDLVFAAVRSDTSFEEIENQIL